jgi:hypothetical protein
MARNHLGDLFAYILKYTIMTFGFDVVACISVILAVLGSIELCRHCFNKNWLFLFRSGSVDFYQRNIVIILKLVHSSYWMLPS